MSESGEQSILLLSRLPKGKSKYIKLRLFITLVVIHKWYVMFYKVVLQCPLLVFKSYDILMEFT